MKKHIFGAMLFIFIIITVISTSVFAHEIQELEFNANTKTGLKKGESITYTFDIEEKSFFFIEINADDVLTKKSNFDVEIKKDDVVIYSQHENSKNSKAVEFGEGLLPGSYSITISCNTEDVELGFYISNKFIPTVYCETESNKSFESALPVEFGKKYYGFTSELSENDYYSFTTFHKGYIEINAENPVEFAIYDSEFNLLTNGNGSSTSAEKPKSLRCSVLPGKIYYLVVKPYVNYPYTFELNSMEDDTKNMESETNNSEETAMEIEADTWYSGFLFDDDDVDFFCVDIPYIDEFKIKLEFPDGEKPYLRVYCHDEDYPKRSKLQIDSVDGNSISYNYGTTNNGRYYFKFDTSDVFLKQSIRYRFKISGEVFDYAIHPETKKIVLKKDLEKEFPKTEDTPEQDSSNKDNQNSIKQFDDVNENSWYHDDILEARSLGLIEGVDENNFAPKNTITVAQAITMAVRFHKDKHGIDFVFGRYDGDKWYDSYLIYAKNAGILKEDDFTQEELNKSATRAQMAYIFASVLGNFDGALFKDIPDVSDKTPYADSIRKLYTLGVLKGNDEHGTFAPDTNISRAEAAVIILRASKI